MKTELEIRRKLDDLYRKLESEFNPIYVAELESKISSLRFTLGEYDVIPEQRHEPAVKYIRMASVEELDSEFGYVEKDRLDRLYNILKHSSCAEIKTLLKPELDEDLVELKMRCELETGAAIVNLICKEQERRKENNV